MAIDRKGKNNMMLTFCGNEKWLKLIILEWLNHASRECTIKRYMQCCCCVTWILFLSFLSILVNSETDIKSPALSWCFMTATLCFLHRLSPHKCTVEIYIHNKYGTWRDGCNYEIYYEIYFLNP